MLHLVLIIPTHDLRLKGVIQLLNNRALYSSIYMYLRQERLGCGRCMIRTRELFRIQHDYAVGTSYCDVRSKGSGLVPAIFSIVRTKSLNGCTGIYILW
jgi:hypothetical protein